jgi:hypothetical protein
MRPIGETPMNLGTTSEGADRRASSARSSHGSPSSAASQPTPLASAAAHSSPEAATSLLASLLERLERMLMAGGGAPVRSGMEKLADTPSAVLVYYIDQAANDFFDKHGVEAVQKSAGVVDREEARALLLLDALGEPLLPAQELSSSGRPCGRQLGESVRLAAGRLDKAAVTAATLAAQPDVELAILAECVAVARAPPRRKRPSTPAEPPAEPAPKHGPRSKRAREDGVRLRQSKTRVRKAHINSRCSCAAVGEPFHDELAGVKSRDFVEHHMFCPMWHCYSYEIGCCEPNYIYECIDGEEVPVEIEPCACLGDAFDELVEPRNITWNSRYMRGRFDECGWLERPGPSALKGSCWCCGFPGRYVPLCLEKRNAGTGERRGDELYFARGEEWGAWDA